jgi:hypothetical protein
VCAAPGGVWIEKEAPAGSENTAGLGMKNPPVCAAPGGVWIEEKKPPAGSENTAGVEPKNNSNAINHNN